MTNSRRTLRNRRGQFGWRGLGKRMAAMSLAMSETRSGPSQRRATVGVRVGEGEAAVTVGAGAPIVVQSMTNTDTAP